MSGYDLDRRNALKGMAALGAAGFIAGLLPVRPARAAALKAGFAYIGPREDWGWNESHAVAALALRGVPHASVAQADYLPESTNYGSGKDNPETRAYTEAMERLITGGAGLVISTSFDEDPFLMLMAKKYPGVVFRQASVLANDDNPPNVGSQNALIHQGHYVNGVAAGLCTASNMLGFVAGMPFGTIETLEKGGTLPNFVVGGYDIDYVRSSPFGAGASAHAINAATTAIAAMKNADAIFVGPINDNNGKLVILAGTTYGPYAPELQKTDHLIEGVIGSLP